MANKDRERALLLKVADIYTDFPKGDIKDCEIPDFLIRRGTQVIGIEVIDYVRGQTTNGSPVRRYEKNLERIAIVARDIFAKESSIPLYVTFHGYPRNELNLAMAETLGKVAADLIAKNIPDEPTQNIRLDRANFKNTPLEGKIRAINVFRVSNPQQSLWVPMSSGVIDAATEEIRNLISAKNRKSNEYKRKCDRVWLLVVADGKYISSNISIGNEVLAAAYESAFERVLFYDLPTQKVFSLNLINV